MPEILFKFESGDIVRVSAPKESNLLEIARNANVIIDAPCSGNGVCGKCRIKLLKGHLRCKKSLHISDEDYALGFRLACESYVEEDVEIGVPDIASAFKKKMKIADLNSSREIGI